MSCFIWSLNTGLTIKQHRCPHSECLSCECTAKTLKDWTGSHADLNHFRTIVFFFQCQSVANKPVYINVIYFAIFIIERRDCVDPQAYVHLNGPICLYLSKLFDLL